MAHKDIRKQFEVKGRRFEAVGFLEEGEPSVDGDEMLKRTNGENGGVIGEEDEGYIGQYHDQLPVELQRYWLVTNRFHNGQRHFLNLFWFYDGRWDRDWHELNRQWREHYIVVRRLP